MATENSVWSESKKVYSKAAFGLFFVGLIALSVIPPSWEINWSYVILGAIAIGLFFAAKKNKTLRNWLIVGVIFFLLYRSGKLAEILGSLLEKVSGLIGPAMIIFLIWLFIPKKKKT